MNDEAKAACDLASLLRQQRITEAVELNQMHKAEQKPTAPPGDCGRFPASKAQETLQLHVAKPPSVCNAHIVAKSIARRLKFAIGDLNGRGDDCEVQICMPRNSRDQ